MRIVLSLTAALLAAACGYAGPCSDLPCTDGVRVEVHHPDAPWQAGQYTVSLVVDGQEFSCSFSAPADLPARGGSAQVACEPAGTESTPGVSISADVLCTEQRTGGGVSESCQPVSDRHLLHIGFQGTPALFSLDLKRGDSSLLSVSETLDYRMVHPNGPECEPVCRQAKLELTVD